MSVKNEHPEYKRMVERWARCRDAADGEDAVHTGGEKYLPKLKDQEAKDYQAYVLRTPFYNATWRTIAGLVGMLFRKPPQVKVPKQVEELLKDVTLSGVPLHLLVQQACEEALKLGRLGVLVDYPAVNVQGLTQADASRLNLRPTIQLYRAESIINWRTGRVNNATVLTMVVLKEAAEVQVDEFTVRMEDRYRVLDLKDSKYRVRMYEVREEKDVLLSEAVPLKRGAALDYIPFTFLSADDNTPEVDEPPLVDLVNINLSHYRTAADYEHGAHFTGLPTPYVCGAQLENPQDKLYIGSTSAWVFKDPTAQVGYLEFTGTGLTALKELLDKKETQMAVLGARMLEQQKRGVESADSQSIHRKGEESMLGAMALTLSLGFEQVLEWFSDWAGATGEVDFELNREFYPVPMTDKMLAALVAAWQQGGISFQTLFENLQAGDVIDGEKTPEEEQAQIGDTPPALQGQETDPVTGAPKSVSKLPKQPPKEGGSTTEIHTPKGEVYKIKRSAA